MVFSLSNENFIIPHLKVYVFFFQNYHVCRYHIQYLLIVKAEFQGNPGNVVYTLMAPLITMLYFLVSCIQETRLICITSNCVSDYRQLQGKHLDASQYS